MEKRKLKSTVDTLIRRGPRRLSEKMIRRLATSKGPFFDARDFPWVERLESNWRTIRAELEVVLKEKSRVPSFHEFSKHQLPITQDDKWKTFFFYWYGHQLPENCERCPETTVLLSQIPGMRTAMLSILGGHKHIPAHRGPYNGVLRYHLGLIVPQPHSLCRIRVGQQFASWEEGKSLIFDDSYEHEVWNDSDRDRVVLFVDFLRPLPIPMSWLNQLTVKLIGWTDYVTEPLARANKPAEAVQPPAHSET